MTEKNRMIHVWHTSIGDDTDVSSHYSTLSEDEKQRARQISQEAVRRRFVAARGLLRRVLAHELDVLPTGLDFAYGQFGKPYLADSNIHFNLAHARDRLLIAVSRDREVGVDVEPILVHRDNLKLARRFFSTREVAQLSSLPPKMRSVAFYNVWVRKEAFVKAVGRGIAFGFHRFSVTVLPEELPRIIDIDGCEGAARLWSLADLDVGTQFAAAVCAQGRDWSVQQRWLS